MDKIAFLDELKTLTTSDDVLKASRGVSELKQKFEDFLIEEERLRQVALLEAGEPVVERQDLDPIREEFLELYRVFQMKRKDAADLKKENQENHLKEKKALLTRLNDIIEKEENIGAAFAGYKEIHEKWKTVGDIPREKRDEIQTEYSKLLERFFYNMKIYRELKEHDLHRNHQLKVELVEKIKALADVKSMREVESQIKLLQNEWEEIGPITESEWEALKTAYWANVKVLYAKINTHYEERRGKLAENIEKKKVLIAEASSLVEALEDSHSAKEWEDKTKQLIQMQNDWKQFGFGPKAENEKVWVEFRAICDNFFGKKKEFYDGLREEFSVFVDKKRKLIDRAKLLHTSTDWKGTSEELIRLQKDWKNTGHAGQRNEQKLWKEFRTACDVFFNNRQKHYEEKDKENEGNLAEKQAIIDEIKLYQVGEDKKQILNDLKEFATRFNAAGHVQIKVKEKVYKTFKQALDEHYSKIKLEGKEKEDILFQAKMDTMKASPDSGRLLDREKSDMRRQIDKMKQEIIQFENNIGFFGNSKGADKMKQEYEKKIEQDKAKIAELIAKMKSIPNE
jgi:hypothetical protein